MKRFVLILLLGPCAAVPAAEESLAPGSPELAANTWVQVKPKYVLPPAAEESCEVR